MSTVSSISGPSLDPNAIKTEVYGKAASSQMEQIKRASEQFEAIFVRQYLGDSLKPMIKGGALEENDTASDTYRYMMTDMLATSLAKQHVFGIGQQIERDLGPRLAATDAAKAAAKGEAGAAASTTNLTTTSVQQAKTNGMAVATIYQTQSNLRKEQ